MKKLILIIILSLNVCQAGFFPETNEQGALEWGAEKPSPSPDAQNDTAENEQNDKKALGRVRVKSEKKMWSFLKTLRPEAPLTLVLKNKRTLTCFYSRSNKLGMEVWTDENFELEGRRAFYYSEIKYIEVSPDSFIEEQPVQEDNYDGSQSGSKETLY